jgi:polyhydroxyalkanoate synthesis regulator phasin
MAKLKFPKTIAAVKSAESSPWVIGKALCDECPVGDSGVKTGSHDRLQEVADEIMQECPNAEGYSISHLQKLRRVAKNFEGCSNRAACSWFTCRVAGTPERLQKVVDAAKAEGKKVTAEYASNFLKPKRQKVKAAGDDTKKAVDAICNRLIKGATTFTKLEMAAEIQEVERSKQRLEELKITVNNLKSPSKKKAKKPSGKTSTKLFYWHQDLEERVGWADAHLEGAIDLLSQEPDRLNVAAIDRPEFDVLMEYAQEILEEAQKLVAILRKQRFGDLTVVQKLEALANDPKGNPNERAAAKAKLAKLKDVS